MIRYKIKGNEVTAYFYDEGYSNSFIWVQDITASVIKKLNISKDEMIKYDIKNIAISVLAHKDNFYGIAKCHPNDYFDVDWGKEIAKQRLLEKFYKYRDKVLVKTIEKLNDNIKIGRCVMNNDKFR